MVTSGRVCVPVCVSVGSVYFCVTVTNSGIIQNNVHVILQTEADVHTWLCGYDY